jgi:hypothetical protein
MNLDVVNYSVVFLYSNVGWDLINILLVRGDVERGGSLSWMWWLTLLGGAL